MKLHHQVILALAVTTALAACGNETSAPSHATNSNAPALSQAKTPAINAPIPRDAISTKLELTDHPIYDEADDSLHVEIRVTNQGKANLVSAGTAMVDLGAMLMGPHGPDQPPGKREFVRTKIPLIAPGNSAVVEAKLPAAQLIGLPIRFELVQEGVAWFSGYGQPTLDIGPYKRCDGIDKSLCDGNNQVVATH